VYVSGAGALSDLTGWGGAKSGVKNVGHVDGMDSYRSAADTVHEGWRARRSKMLEQVTMHPRGNRGHLGLEGGRILCTHQHHRLSPTMLLLS